MFADWLDIPAGRVLFGLWVFVLGGAVGSFLNVVVYRLPRGESLVFPPSHCPQCGHRIRWYDNVPIASWMILGGRCRDCRGAIALRYPVVEATSAAMFLVMVLWVGIGGHLPQRPVIVGQMLVSRSWTPLESLSTAAFHLVLLATLLAAGLIEYDRHRLPARLAVPALVIGAIVPVVWPQVRPVPAFAALPATPGWLARGLEALAALWVGLVEGLAGLGVGLAIGLAAWRLVGRRERLGWVVGPACLGLFLGWQACLGISAVAVALHGASGLLQRRWEWGATRLARLSPGLVFWFCGLGWIIAWERLWGMCRVLG